MTNEELFQRIIGKCILNKRRSSGWSQAELAERAEVSEKHMSDLENGKSCPSSYTLARIQLVLDINSDEFLLEFEEKRSKQT